MAKTLTTIAREDEIAQELAKKVNREKILAKFCKKWQVKPRTIDAYIKGAKPKADELLKADEKAVKKARYDEKLESEKRSIEAELMTVEQKRQLFKDIAFGKLLMAAKKPAWNNHAKKFEIITVYEEPSHADRIKAAQEDSKLADHYPAEKHDITTGGSKIMDPMAVADSKLTITVSNGSTHRAIRAAKNGDHMP